MRTEESLDPDDWRYTRELGHRMVDDMMDYMQTVRDRPVWRHAPPEVGQHFTAPVPLEPQPLEDVYEEFRHYVLPYPLGNDHPLFWGWVMGTGTATGALADFLAAAMNTNTGGVDFHSANYVERQVIDWFKVLMGFPEEASGLLTSGCSAANLIGLAVARNTKAGHDLRRDGVNQSGAGMLTLYASTEIHSSIQKAVELLGLGSIALRRIRANDQFQVDIEALSAAIEQDRSAGHHPICVVGAAGTTNTGAIDDLGALADLCKREQLWLHVDGAFGAWAVLIPEMQDRLAGMERADSLAFDLHKWMYLPYEIGCLLVGNEASHREAFSLTPDYLAHGEGGQGMSGGDLPWFSDYGFQLSRGFRALKAWMSLKEQGVHKYSRLVDHNIAQARYLGERIEDSPYLELAAPIALNVVCFRYVDVEIDAATLDTINRQILVQLQERGLAVPSGTLINDRFVLHVAITNHRSRYEDFDTLVGATIEIGQVLLRSMRVHPR